MSAIHRVPFSMCSLLLLLLLFGRALPGECRAPGPEGQQCIDQGIPPGEVCPPLIGAGVVAEPGFTVGPIPGTSPTQYGPLSSVPNVAHPIECGSAFLDYREEEGVMRDVYFGRNVGGCEVATCENDPPCSTSLAMKLAQIGSGCSPSRWDSEGNLDGLTLSCPAPVEGGVEFGFVVEYTLRPAVAIVDPDLLIAFYHRTAGERYRHHDPDPTPSPSTKTVTGTVNLPYGTSYVQMTVSAQACANAPGFPFPIGETENYEIQVSPGPQVTVRPFFRPEILSQVVECP
jgi:hypothetical protein